MFAKNVLKGGIVNAFRVTALLRLFELLRISEQHDAAGRLSNGKTFRLGLSADQTLTIRSLNGSLRITWVKGPTGFLYGEKPDEESTEYFTEADGWHYVRITSYSGRGNIQFCAE